MCVLAFEISHRPNGKLTFCSLLTGRWCRSLRRHSDHLIVHHKLEHSFNWRRCRCRFCHSHDNVFLDLRESSFLCACSCSKVPIAPMGDSRFACCLQGGGVYVGSGTVTITSSSIYGNTAYAVRAHVQSFPSPQWETHVLLVAYRAVVSQSSEAQ
ncbi:hypothetical protein Ctob_015846 [Chrysochromulina tobinii]|uniref:Uncharacterized protein n=1 Tax=Chrysochromulina tobinii TaxID=1460289 RepID=A0A0M0JZ50_9EUKA|nr:hypothetical protein Ctob_015846 [Chrysochromulina tobinii]|eukprot:KOO31403.1 hypothetical protein Ctob_015846 [Chrysochromulina sp. CCMP291]